MKNDEYWQKRAEQRLVEAEQIAKRAEQEMRQAFDAAYANIEAQIYKLYGKYATDNSMSYAEALIYLTDDEREEFRRDLVFYIEHAKDADYRTEFKAYLQALSTRARVRRLEAYQAHLKMIAEQLYTEALIPRAAEVMQTVVTGSYLKAAFDVSQALGLLAAFDQPSQRLVDQVLEYPWSGKNFSRKWYDSCDNFEVVLDETLTKGLITGASNQKIARELRDKTGASYKRAERLVRTETNYAHNQATAALYEDVGVERYRYLATLDLRTSPMCREMDGKVIAYADKVDGVNYPPLHPWCRSTTVPVIYEDDVGTRVARDKDGKTYKVPADMTYKEWYAKYVANDPEMLKQELMVKNRAADKAMYERYREIFKDTNMLKSFEDFTWMKYNNPEGYKALTAQYREMNSLYKEYRYNRDGTIRITDDWKGEHKSIPRDYKPFAVIEKSATHANGFRQIDRTIYGEDGRMLRQLHTGDHDKPKRHPFGAQGEHYHEYVWGEDGTTVDRTPKEMTDKHRKEAADILPLYIKGSDK